jgi:hypothetical protein
MHEVAYLSLSTLQTSVSLKKRSGLQFMQAADEENNTINKQEKGV